MKEMTCKELGGACDKIFRANTFDEIAEISKLHGQEMFKRGDPDHLKAMEKMRTLMEKPEAMNRWFEEKKEIFESHPDIS